MLLPATKVLNAMCRFLYIWEISLRSVASALFILFKPDFCAQNPVRIWRGRKFITGTDIPVGCNTWPSQPPTWALTPCRAGNQDRQLSDEAQNSLPAISFQAIKQRTSFSRVCTFHTATKWDLNQCVQRILPKRTPPARDTRAARTRSGKGFAGGTFISPLKFPCYANKLHWPDISVFEFMFRTASGTRFAWTRAIATAGRIFCGSVLPGKISIWIKEKGNHDAAFPHGRHLLYQTYDLQHLQNDAPLYGAGLEFNSKNSRSVNKWADTPELPGYRRSTHGVYRGDF